MGRIGRPQKLPRAVSGTVGARQLVRLTEFTLLDDQLDHTLPVGSARAELHSHRQDVVERMEDNSGPLGGMNGSRLERWINTEAGERRCRWWLSKRGPAAGRTPWHRVWMPTTERGGRAMEPLSRRLHTKKHPLFCPPSYRCPGATAARLASPQSAENPYNLPPSVLLGDSEL